MCDKNHAPDLNVESFRSGDAAPFKYDPIDSSIGNNYNEAVLSGASRKKELESSMAQSSEPMYSSIEKNGGSMRLASDNSTIMDTRQDTNQATRRDTNCVFSRIFESIR